MCDPIIDEAAIPSDHVLQQFKKESIQEYLQNKEKFHKYPLRHYSQLELPFDDNLVKKLLGKLGIPISNTTVTIFGGYTGQFAECLRTVGMQVVFTDLMMEWVEKAANNGFEAYNYAFEEIPKDLIKRTELFATFECYDPLVNSGKFVYNTLRFLTAKFGLLFAESKQTVNEIRRESDAKTMLKSSFLAHKKLYNIRRISRGKSGLRFYHFCASEEARKTIESDCKICKIIYDNFPTETHFEIDDVVAFAKRKRLGIDKLVFSLPRIKELYQLKIPQAFRTYELDNAFQIFSKRFYLEYDPYFR